MTEAVTIAQDMIGKDKSLKEKVLAKNPHLLSQMALASKNPELLVDVLLRNPSETTDGDSESLLETLSAMSSSLLVSWLNGKRTGVRLFLNSNCTQLLIKIIELIKTKWYNSDLKTEELESLCEGFFPAAAISWSDDCRRFVINTFSLSIYLRVAK